MRVAQSTWLAHATAIPISMIAAATTLGSAAALAHENHAPLPSKGVAVAGNMVLLSDKARTAIDLTTTKVTFADLHHTLDVNARVELPWNQQAMITSLVPGKVDQVRVRPGEIVSAGQELARVVSMELESIQLSMLQAAGELALAKRLVEQRRDLDAEGVIAGKTLLEAETTLAQKTAELRIAREKLHALGIGNQKLQSILSNGQPIPFIPITSPIDGVITHADVRIGQVVRTTDHLYHVVNPSRVWIVGEVLESDVWHLAEGQSVAAKFVAYRERQFDGVIDHLRLKMDRRTHTQSVVIAVDNRDGLLRPGMFGRVAIAVRTAKEVVVCPTDAIIKSRGRRYVLVERKRGKYENRLVELGITKGKRVEVLDGVFPGDKVVVTGAYLLASLLGNEHKARKPDHSRTAGDGTTGSPQRPITVADAIVELPTDQQAYASPRIEGRIRRVLIRPSQHVQAGQVLAEVDSLQLRTAQLDLLQTVSRLRLTEQSLTHLKPLRDRSITPQRRLWELQNQRDTLVQQVASRKRQLAFFGLTGQQVSQLEQTDFAAAGSAVVVRSTVPVRAPVAGWIVGFHVVPGQVVRPEDQLFEIHDLSKVWVKGHLFERDIAQVAIGQPARVTFSAFPDLKVVGTVVRIAPIMEGAELVLPVWVEVVNSDRLLKQGMLARVTILPAAAVTANTATESSRPRPVAGWN